MRCAAVLVAALLVVDVAVVVEAGNNDPANCARYGPNKCKKNKNIRKYCTWNPDVNLPDGLCEVKVPKTKAPVTDEPTPAPTSYPSSTPTSDQGHPVEPYENPCYKHGRGSRAAKKACAADADCIWTGLKGPGHKPKPGPRYGKCINRSASPTPAPTVTAPTLAPVTRMPTTVADVCNDFGKVGCKSGKFAGPQPGAPDGCKWDKTNKICGRNTASPTPMPTTPAPTPAPTTNYPTTMKPTKQPTTYPTKEPTDAPTGSGTQAPVAETDQPSPAPTAYLANVLPANMGSPCFSECGSVVEGGSCPQFCGAEGECCIQGSANNADTSSNCWNSLIGGADSYVCVKSQAVTPMSELDFYTGEVGKGMSTSNKLINHKCTNIAGDAKTKNHDMPVSYGTDVDQYLEDVAVCCNEEAPDCVAFDFDTDGNTMRLIKTSSLSNKASTVTSYLKNECGYSSTGKCANPMN